MPPRLLSSIVGLAIILCATGCDSTDSSYYEQADDSSSYVSQTSSGDSASSYSPPMDNVHNSSQGSGLGFGGDADTHYVPEMDNVRHSSQGSGLGFGGDYDPNL